ncbi:hypothetical protein [Synechococcus phage Yong-L2-223]|nr:hypothetical protein [Synechococcus phage Yong-L2-223]
MFPVIVVHSNTQGERNRLHHERAPIIVNYAELPSEDVWR